MKNKPFKKAFVLAFLVLIVFGSASVFGQTVRANGRIAFSRDNEIYSINPDGTGLRRLTFDVAEDNYPAWSPDGRKIAYLSRSGQSFIKTMNADGSGQQIVTPVNFDLTTQNFCGESFSLSWSPDGGRIAFQETGNIIQIKTDGTARQTLTNSPLRESEPSWGRNGVIAYASTLWGGDDLNGLDIKTTDGRIFAWYGYYTCSVSPDWSPDGTKLAYVHSADFPPPGAIVIFQATPPYSERWIIPPIGVMNVRWSPDGRLLVYERCYPQPCMMETFDEFGQNGRTITNGKNPSWGVLTPPSSPTADFDGDGKADISVFRNSDRTWYLNQSSRGFAATQFGLSTDKLTPADFDGDGRTDIGVFRAGTWYWLNSSNNDFNAIQFGLAGDIPQPADFTGDGRAELAVYRNGVWWSLDLSNDQSSVVRFGLSTDKAVAADYDGDGRADQAVYRNGEWHLNLSGQGYAVIYFGLSTDKPVGGDYDGDGKADPAVYRHGIWYLQRSQLGFTAFQWGIASDLPAPADYDGDGRTDAAVFRPSNSTWYMNQTSSGVGIVAFGSAGDRPVPSAFVP